ncbi:sorting nexin-10, partial [Elysia marginata]
MTRPKRKKNGASHTQSEDSLCLEHDIITRLQTLEQKIEQTSKTNTQKLLEEIEKLKSAIHDITIENDSLKKELKSLKEERSIIVDEMQQLRYMVDVLHEKQNDMEQYHRRNNVRIFGVKDLEQYEKAEDTVREVSNILKSKLHLTHLDSSCIDIAHRVGVYRKKADRAIIVRLTSHKAQNDIIRARRALKGTGIMITEDSTPKNAALLHK